eukprot:7820318-Ditylum_brightwellii.AAC.1
MKEMDKKAIVDRGYQSLSTVDERVFFPFPDNMDSKELHWFKSRSYLHHKSFNVRIKMYRVLQG